MDSATEAAAWTVYDYEVDMFSQTWDMCLMGANKTFRYPISNAIVESMLLHLRILVDILISKGSSPDNDDIKLKNLLPKFDSVLIGTLRIKYGTRSKVRSPCWTLNKMLAHPSMLRSNNYKYDDVLNIMVPCIMPLLDEIERARRVFSSQ